MKKMTVDVTLDAPAERIWELLTDFSVYPQWNTLFTKVSVARPKEGAFELQVHLPGIGPFMIKPTILAVQPEQRLSWESRLLHEKVFCWSYSYELDRMRSGRIRVAQTSEFSGALESLFHFSLETPLKSGMEQLNQALKRWGEKGSAQCHRC